MYPLLAVLLFSFGLGIGIACWIAHFYKERAQLAIASAPILGYALFAVFSIYPIFFNADKIWIPVLFFILLSASMGLLCLYLFKHRPSSWRPSWKPLIFGGTIVALLVVFNLANFRDGILFHYINPDPAAYALSSQWIAQGGVLREVLDPLTREIMVVTARWGLPSFVGLILYFFPFSAYEALFPVVLVVLGSGTASASLLFVRAFHKEEFDLIPLTTFTILFNGSLLYFLYEGFYPFVIGIAGMAVVTGICASSSAAMPRWTPILFASILMAALIATCSELFCLTAAMILGISIIDFLVSERQNRLTPVFLLVLFVGVILVLPLSYKIASFTVKNIANSNQIGYPQPTWVWPSDIIGLTNIYSRSKKYLGEDLSVQLASRTPLAKYLALVLSLWVLFEFRRWRKNSIFLVAGIGSVSILLLNLFLVFRLGYEPYNYLYDKLVIAFSPVFTFLFFAAVRGDRGLLLRTKLFIALVCVCISGYLFFSDKREFKGSVDLVSIQEIREKVKLSDDFVFVTNERGYRKGAMVGQFRYIDRASDYILCAVLGYKVIDQWATATWDSFPPNSKVFLIVNRSHLRSEKELLQKNENSPVVVTRSYFVFDTQKRLADLYPQNKVENLNRLYLRY